MSGCRRRPRPARRWPAPTRAVAQPAQRLAPAALLPEARPRERSRAPRRQGSTARSSGRPGPWSASRAPRSAPRPSWTGSGWPAAAAVLDDPVGRLRPRRSTVSIQTAAAAARSRNRRAGADAERLDPGQMEVGEEVIGERGPAARSAIASKALLAGHVDLDFGADRAHSGAILFSRRTLASEVRQTVPVDCRLTQARVSEHNKNAGRRTIFTSISPRRSHVETGSSSRLRHLSSASTAARQLSLRENDALPECPHCGATIFRRDSIFESMQDHGATTAEFAAPPRPSAGLAGRGAGDAVRRPAAPPRLARETTARSALPDRARAGRESAAAPPPTCGSTTRASRADTR